MHILKYLKEMGLSGDIKNNQLDNKLLLSLDDEGKNKLHNAWFKLHNYNNSDELYLVPQTLKQASFLFSHDYQRIKTSMEWIFEMVDFLNTDSIIDMGCGYGILINYLKIKFPNKKFMGIDRSKNLINIGKSISGIDLICGDYLKIKPNDSYDTIICDFGFDLADLRIKNLSCKTSVIGNIEYCPNCCKEFKKNLLTYMSSWKKWGNKKSNLLMNGRLTSNPSYLLATIEAANEFEWSLNIEKTSCLKTYDKRTKTSEKFIGLPFESKKHDKDNIEENFIKVMKLFEME